MKFVHTFKGYEDKTTDIDHEVNEWILKHKVQVVDIKTVMAHEFQGRSNSGDLLYTLIYEAEKPIVM